LISFSFSLSLSFSQDFSKLLFRVTNETLTTQFALLSSKGKKITSKPHHENRRAFKAPRKEFFVAKPLLRRRRIRRKRVFLGVLFNPFLSETSLFKKKQRRKKSSSSLQSLCSFVF
jgi:hypothetical protein